MNWIIYGANGYTGELLAREAAARGLRPVLAGRNREKVSSLAAELGLEACIFSLDDPVSVVRGIGERKLVLHCAGPFSKTSRPMLEACIEAGAHYLDITGEISVFQYAHARSDQARRADVVLVSGVGFDVVPSDCLARCLVDALPAATRLVLAFEAGGGPSPGTAKTAIEGMGTGGVIRRDGELVTVPLAWKTRTIPFADRERLAVTIPWGDVYTAWVSTGIPNVEVYMSMPPSAITRIKRLRWIQPLLGLRPIQAILKKQIGARVRGPSGERRNSSRSQLWGEASSADGRSVSATMTTPNGYALTVSAGLGVVEFLLENDVEGGYYTPSLLMGANYAATLPGVSFNLCEV